ncbi:hypothetical protein QAD02_001650 [Eretmocerus hayati]|uniref:Uncharacterized protein n=1 Tax=Eretmocerus hayati TaxID=131215 RepID=A0ACC2NIE2_9HYME|nr:hypothetical protein QAD02_001650 [Eretmocerus hayati]
MKFLFLTLCFTLSFEFSVGGILQSKLAVPLTPGDEECNYGDRSISREECNNLCLYHTLGLGMVRGFCFNGSCRCEWQEPDPLEFDHAQRSTKIFSTKGKFSPKFGERFAWSWFRKKQEPVKLECRNPVRYEQNPCQRRPTPECPHITQPNVPSKCAEEGFGKPMKRKRKWLIFPIGPKVIKQKPSNCDPPPCPRELSFKEYIFGPEEPLPDPLTCRAAWKYMQSCNAPDERLNDPSYQLTPGDVMLHTSKPIYERFKVTEPKPKSPPPYRAPVAVFCKRLSDTISGVNCYDARPSRTEPCVPDICPVHSQPSYTEEQGFRLPYEELRAPTPRRRYLACDRGIHEDEVQPPVRRESLPERPLWGLPPAHSNDCCGAHEPSAAQLREAVLRGAGILADAKATCRKTIEIKPAKTDGDEDEEFQLPAECKLSRNSEKWKAEAAARMEMDRKRHEANMSSRQCAEKSEPSTEAEVSAPAEGSGDKNDEKEKKDK